jgi:hypothetical protein
MPMQGKLGACPAESADWRSGSAHGVLVQAGLAVLLLLSALLNLVALSGPM